MKIFKRISLFCPYSAGTLPGANFSSNASSSSFVNYTSSGVSSCSISCLMCVCVVCAVAVLAVIGDEIFHHVFHCAYYVRRIGPVLGFQGCPCRFTLHFPRGQFVHHAPRVGVGCAGAEVLP